MNPSTPSQRGEFDSSKTSHPWATACIQVPVFERKAPDQKSRKLRCRSARNISLTLRLRSGWISICVDMKYVNTIRQWFAPTPRQRRQRIEREARKVYVVVTQDSLML